ncbi:MAG: leucine-rich repeat protein [Bacteroidales bacterium]|nr:leucine-rich repeat protein [Bacteroidales bacterium]
MDFNSLIKDGIVVIPQGVTEISDDAFMFTGLTRIEIPNSVTKIGNSAFAHCKGLSSIEIPDSVTKIEEGAFSSCTGLTSIEVPDSVTEIGKYTFCGCTGLTRIEIPDSVTKIGEDAFSGCTSLTSIEIPDSVNDIKEHAFSGCSSINSIVVDSQNVIYKSQNNSILSKDGRTLVLGCMHSLIPDSVTKIGNAAFEGCTGLSSIEIPNSVKIIGEYTFRGCTGLTRIEIPDSVTEIGANAFSGCTRLTSMEIPDSVKVIGTYAFRDCTSLTSIEIPNSVTEIQVGAFYGCHYSLRDVYINYKKPELVPYFLRTCGGDNTTLHVPIGTGYAYRHSEFGGRFKAVLADYNSGNKFHSEQTASTSFHDRGCSIKTSPIHYLFFDTETTGLPRDYKAPSTSTNNWPRMVQLSWVSQDKDGKTIKKGNYIIRPEGFSIPTQASDIHGITTSRALREGVSLRQALNEFLEDAKQAKVLVGHNVSFDMKVLGCECVRLFGSDSIRSMKSIDTMEAATNYCAIPGYYGYKWPKLQELHRKLFGYEFDDAHDSSADIAATAKCYWEMKKRGLI